MKQLLIQLLAALGLVPAARYAALKNYADEQKAGVLEWKTKTRDALEQVKTLTAEARRHAKDAEQLQEQEADLRDLKKRLMAAERELMAAREHLMAVEVKLDILEGAANVLDLRTRAVISSGSRVSG